MLDCSIVRPTFKYYSSRSLHPHRFVLCKTVLMTRKLHCMWYRIPTFLIPWARFPLAKTLTAQKRIRFTASENRNRRVMAGFTKARNFP